MNKSKTNEESGQKDSNEKDHGEAVPTGWGNDDDTEMESPEEEQKDDGDDYKFTKV